MYARAPLPPPLRRAQPLLSTHLSHLPALRSLHILSSANSEAVMSEEDVRNLAQACGPELRQVGFRNRVWLVSINWGGS